MKNKKEKLFQDRDIVIPFKHEKRGDTLSFWVHKSKIKGKRKKISAFISPSNSSLNSERLEGFSLTMPSMGKGKTFHNYKVGGLQYVDSVSKNKEIKIFFKKRKNMSERVRLNIIYAWKSIRELPQYVRNIFKSGFPDLTISRLFQVDERERLCALGSFWSTQFGRFIFSASANAFAALLVPPLFMFRNRLYLVDIPNVERLGHAVANVDVLFAEFTQGLYKTNGKEKTLIVFYPKISYIEDTGFVYFPKIDFISQIKKSIIKKNIRIIYLHPWIEKIVKRVLSKKGGNFLITRPCGHRDIFNILKRTPPIFSLSKKEEIWCLKYFEKKNVKIDKPLVLCSNRSSGNINYEKSDNKLRSESKRYGYRNSPFNLLVPAIKELLDKGYNIIKVGASCGVRRFSSENYFDFSSELDSEKNILLDFFLFSRCLFFFGDTSGNYSLAQAFRKPICFFNFAPFGHFHSWDIKTITIFKNMINKQTGKLEKFRDLLKYQYGYEIHNEKNSPGRSYIDNTASGISETVKEMEARFSGTSYQSNESLQKQFRKLFLPSYVHQSVNARCGDFFLKKYEHLL